MFASYNILDYNTAMHTQTITCPDCGPTPAIHFVEKSSSIIEWITEPLDSVLFSFLPHTPTRPPKYTGIFLLWLYRAAAFVRIAKLTTDYSSDDTDRLKTMWDAARKHGVLLHRLRLLNRPTEFFIAQYKKYTWAFTSLPRPFGYKNTGKDWMDSKEKMREHFAPAGIPIAKGGSVFSWRAARRLFNDIKGMVITKPTYGSRSRHTILHIQTEEQLRHGFVVAKKMGPWVVIEQELPGSVYRAAVIAGKVVAVLRRDPPQVLGDGVHTIQELVTIANQDGRRHGPTFHEITIDADALSELQYQQLTLESVPEKNMVVRLAQKVGRSNGGTNVDVTDTTHPENIALFEKVLEVLDDSLVGIDCIMPDIAKPWHEQLPCGIIECNSVPFLDLHHYPFEGKVRDTAGALWDAVLQSLTYKKKPV